jgi:hypothetical protein
MIQNNHRLSPQYAERHDWQRMPNEAEVLRKERERYRFTTRATILD